MSLDTTATTKGNGRMGLDLVEAEVERNRDAASRFVRLVELDVKKARRYYDYLPAGVQDYVKHSLTSKPFYDRIFKNGNESGNGTVRNL